MLALTKQPTARGQKKTGASKAGKPSSEENPVDAIIDGIADIRALSHLRRKPGDTLPDPLVASRVGTAIRMLRIYRVMSQAQLAKKLEITQGQLSNIELAKSTPDICLLYRVAKAFGVGLSDFLRLADVN